jgi:hypothetical protein
LRGYSTGYGDIEARLARLSSNAEFDFVSKIPAIPSDFSPSEAFEFRETIRRPLD